MEVNHFPLLSSLSKLPNRQLIWNLVDWCKEEEQGLTRLTENISRTHWHSYQLEGASNPHTNPTTHRKHHNQHKHLDPYTPQLFFFLAQQWKFYWWNKTYKINWSSHLNQSNQTLTTTHGTTHRLLQQNKTNRKVLNHTKLPATKHYQKKKNLGK